MIEPNQGIITVPDERLVRLAEIVHPSRIVPATYEIVNFTQGVCTLSVPLTADAGWGDNWLEAH